MKRSVVFYLAVLPKYREQCMAIVQNALGDDLHLFVSSAHLDKSVKTGIPASNYTRVPMLRGPRRLAFLQLRHWREALAADVTIVDLNPRSVTAWVITAARTALRRRTLVWGHLKSQGAHNAYLRRALRRLANGTISYTYEDREYAIGDLPAQPVWVAANALYRRIDIRPAESDVDRTVVLYVGRLESVKKIELLIRGFSLAVDFVEDIRLTLVGDGTQRSKLADLAEQLGVLDRVDFVGWIDDVEELREYYERAICTVSTGFAGLGLTQSLGFGIPMAVARGERHSPEIELASTGAVMWFDRDSPPSLANALQALYSRRARLPDRVASSYVSDNYSAEAMAAGLLDAISGHEQKG
ncbi:glycosyltransferase [Humibacter sp. BT305]|nr:glycosyltransferase [Humibacter sp. BT305]